MANETTARDQGAEERAVELSGAAREEARGVVDDARQEASAVASEASAQARNLVDGARSALRDQASDGTERAAGAIGELGTRFRALADGDVEGAGDLSRYAGEMSERLRGAADRLGDRGVDGIVDDLQRFARRRPGLFLTAAATSGFVAGRLFRGARSESDSPPPPGSGPEHMGTSPESRDEDAQAAALSGFEPNRPAGESDAGVAGSGGGPTVASTPYGGTSAPVPGHGTSARDAGERT